MARASLRWILDQAEVTCVIPGFIKNVRQVEDNLSVLDTPAAFSVGLVGQAPAYTLAS